MQISEQTARQAWEVIHNACSDGSYFAYRDYADKTCLALNELGALIGKPTDFKVVPIRSDYEGWLVIR